jgi:predicted secreted hydrolase
MDHQYGSWNQVAIERWTWHAIHLTTGHEIMIYDIYKTGGAAEHLCDVLGPDGVLQANQSCAAKPTRKWNSPRTGRKWSIAWRVEIPALGARLQIAPDSDDREVSNVIYEGGCAVSGELGGKPVAGRSFYEEHQRLPVDELKKLAREQKGKK